MRASPTFLPAAAPHREPRLQRLRGIARLLVHEASTSYGKIESEVTLLVEAGQHDSKQMRAQLDGGGPTIELRTQSGDVHLKRVAP